MSINFDDGYVADGASSVRMVDAIFPDPPPDVEIDHIDNINKIDIRFGYLVYIALNCTSLDDLNPKLGGLFSQFYVTIINKDVFDKTYTCLFHEDMNQIVKLEIILKLFRDDSNQYAIQVKSFRSSSDSNSEELFWSINKFLLNAGFRRLTV